MAEHCICCAKEAEARGLSARVILACLLHDASECYMSDVPRPFKKEMDAYQEQEENLLSTIYEKFLGSDLTEKEQAQVCDIDDVMLWYDLENLLEEEQDDDMPEVNIKLDYISFAKQSLVVNIGAKVMLTANDTNGEYVNGTMGTIIDISKERGDATCIQVLTDKGKKVDVYRYEREIERQDIEEREEKDENGKTVIAKKIVRKIVGSFKQFPIKIAWAISIHKSQGQTFGQVNIDPRCWDSGQFYVAVSRAESIAGIHFLAPIMKQYIRTLSDKVIKILENSLKVIE